MLKTFCIGAAAAVLAFSPAAARETPTVTYDDGPVQGHPFMIQVGTAITIYDVPPHPLQFALIDGRRALVDRDTFAVIYWLKP